jgi:hypothetical protein
VGSGLCSVERRPSSLAVKAFCNLTSLVIITRRNHWQDGDESSFPPLKVAMTPILIIFFDSGANSVLFLSFVFWVLHGLHERSRNVDNETLQKPQQCVSE